MIEYVIAESPDDRVLQKASDLLSSGELVVLPTDTNWVVLADPFSKKGIEKIYKFKNIDKLKTLALLCRNFSKASEVAYIEDSVYRQLKKVIPGHYTFIFKATKKIIRSVQANKMDHEVGLRFVPSLLVDRLLEVHGESLISTNLNREQLGLPLEDEIYSYQIEEKCMGHVKMIIDPGEYHFAGPSTIIDFTTDAPELIREGAGKFPFN